jgi:hypothetical protein
VSVLFWTALDLRSDRRGTFAAHIEGWTFLCEYFCEFFLLMYASMAWRLVLLMEMACSLQRSGIGCEVAEDGLTNFLSASSRSII